MASIASRARQKSTEAALVEVAAEYEEIFGRPAIVAVNQPRGWYTGYKREFVLDFDTVHGPQSAFFEIWNRVLVARDQLDQGLPATGVEEN